MHDKLDETNSLLYAAKYYDNPHCYDTVEFYEDLNRFKYIKRLLNKYQEGGELKERLIINHLIVIYNVFGAVPGTRLLFLKLKDQLPLIMPFLVLMGTLPDVVENVGIENRSINTSDITMDPYIVDVLRKINGQQIS
jgi:hypothetical protein